METEPLLKALNEADGNKAEAARTLDILIRNLYNKLLCTHNIARRDAGGRENF